MTENADERSERIKRRRLNEEMIAWRHARQSDLTAEAGMQNPEKSASSVTRTEAIRKAEAAEARYQREHQRAIVAEDHLEAAEAEVERLRVERDQLLQDIAGNRNENRRYKDYLMACKAERERLREALQKIADRSWRQEPTAAEITRHVLSGHEAKPDRCETCTGKGVIVRMPSRIGKPIIIYPCPDCTPKGEGDG